MSAGATTAPDLRPAQHIVPGDLVRRDNGLWRVIRIAISTGAVEAEGERLGGAPAFASFSFLPGELVRIARSGDRA